MNLIEPYLQWGHTVPCISHWLYILYSPKSGLHRNFSTILLLRAGTHYVSKKYPQYLPQRTLYPSSTLQLNTSFIGLLESVIMAIKNFNMHSSRAIIDAHSKSIWIWIRPSEFELDYVSWQTALYHWRKFLSFCCCFFFFKEKIYFLFIYVCMPVGMYVNV